MRGRPNTMTGASTDISRLISMENKAKVSKNKGVKDFQLPVIPKVLLPVCLYFVWLGITGSGKSSTLDVYGSLSRLIPIIEMKGITRCKLTIISESAVRKKFLGQVVSYPASLSISNSHSLECHGFVFAYINQCIDVNTA